MPDLATQVNQVSVRVSDLPFEIHADIIGSTLWTSFDGRLDLSSSILSGVSNNATLASSDSYPQLLADEDQPLDAATHDNTKFAGFRPTTLPLSAPTLSTTLAVAELSNSTNGSRSLSTLRKFTQLAVREDEKAASAESGVATNIAHGAEIVVDDANRRENRHWLSMNFRRIANLFQGRK